MTIQEISAEIARRVPELARDGVVNNCETITQILKHGMVPRCIYCNAPFRVDTQEERERLADHIMTCKLSPVVEMLNVTRAFADAQSKAIEASNRYVELLERNNAALEKELSELKGQK